MKKIEIDLDVVERLKAEGYTWQQVSDITGVKCETLRKRAYKYGFPQTVPYQLGKRRCSKCNSYFMRNDLKKTRFGLYCEECAKL